MKIIVAILIFGVIILIHEFGHFILARTNGIEVLDFSIGMGPKLCGFHAMNTQFSIRLFPIGGACMMRGEDLEIAEKTVKESDDAENTVKEPDEHSFYSKNVWQRIAVLFAGPGFNFILAFVLSLVIIGMAGYDPATVSGVTENKPAALAGIEKGDTIVKINHTSIAIGREVDSYFDYHPLTEEPISITVKRNGEKITYTVTPKQIVKYMLGFSYSGTDTGEAKIQEISAGYPMEAAGLKENDIILEIGGVKIANSGELSTYFNQHALTEEPVSLVVLRDAEELTFTITPKYAYTAYTIGMDYNLARVQTGVLGTIYYSVHEVKYWIVETAHGLVKLFTGKLKSNEIGSAVAVVDVIGQTYEASVEYGVKDTVLNMLYITILLSANIGVMNLLPIPALDGGKLLFCFIEVVRGKPIDREKEGIVHFIGFVLLMILMVFLVFNDIKNIFFR